MGSVDVGVGSVFLFGIREIFIKFRKYIKVRFFLFLVFVLVVLELSG